MSYLVSVSNSTHAHTRKAVEETMGKARKVTMETAGSAISTPRLVLFQHEEWSCAVSLTERLRFSRARLGRAPLAIAAALAKASRVAASAAPPRAGRRRPGGGGAGAGKFFD